MSRTNAVHDHDADARTWSGGRTCVHEHCRAWSIRSPDLLSYSRGHHVWSCRAGHRVVDAALLRRPRDEVGPGAGPAIGPATAAAPLATAADRLAAAGDDIDGQADLDLPEFLQVLIETCTNAAGADTGSVVLAASTGDLHQVASSVEDGRLRELTGISAADGPAFACFTTARTVALPDLGHDDQQWPAFARAARRSGVRSAHVTPLRLSDGAIGSLSLFFDRTGGLDVGAARALGSLTDRAAAAAARAQLARAVDVRSHRVAQLHLRLDSRVLIEQAKGVLMAVHGIGPDAARRRMSDHGDLTGRSPAQVARAVLERTLELPLPHDRGLPADADPARDGRRWNVDQEITALIDRSADAHDDGGRAELAGRQRRAADSLRGGSGALLSGDPMLLGEVRTRWWTTVDRDRPTPEPATAEGSRTRPRQVGGRDV